jgi:hypothetical protein
MIKVIAVMLSLVPVHDVLTPDGYVWVPGLQINRAGQSCCGANDCYVVPKDLISMDASGYWVGSGFIPFEETLPSQDGEFWLCVHQGRRLCFFAPPPST